MIWDNLRCRHILEDDQGGTVGEGKVRLDR